MGCGQTYTQPMVWSESSIFVTSATTGTYFTEQPKSSAPPEGWLAAKARARARRRGEKR